MSLEITHTTLDDLPQIAKIYDNHVLKGLASFEYEAPGLEEMTRRYEKLIAQNYPYLSAKENERIIGYAYVSSFHTKEAYKKTVENTIYLAPEAQGRGIGSQLLEKLMEVSKDCGFLQMVAVIARLDPPVSIKLHEKLGFEMCGTLKKVGFKHGKWLDVVHMQKSLLDE